jgi:putative phage-type endonuclease
MQVHNLVQGSPEWHAYRRNHFNASDAPAMLGCSPYKTRDQLIAELATGIVPEVDEATQRIFDAGHRFEALARPLAEKIIGEELAPLVGSNGKYSASFDGITLMLDTAFEHKTLNSTLRSVMLDGCRGSDLPKMYRAQLEQQCMVTGTDNILFMATKWDGEDLVEERHCWYTTDPDLRDEIIAGWEQIEKDVAAYVAPGAAPQKVVAEPVEALPAPVVQVSGQITLCDNFKVFEQRLRDFLDNKLIRNPKTDEDFVNLDAQIKAMKSGREALKGARAQMLAQVQPVDQADKVAEMLDSLLQQNCSMAERLLKDEKERRRSDIVLGGKAAFAAHVGDLNREIAPIKIRLPEPDFGGGIRGLKSLASMEAKVSSELAQAKVHANEIARETRARLAWFAEAAKGYEFLFPDLQEIIFL